MKFHILNVIDSSSYANVKVQLTRPYYISINDWIETSGYHSEIVDVIAKVFAKNGVYNNECRPYAILLTELDKNNQDLTRLNTMLRCFKDITDDLPVIYSDFKVEKAYSLYELPKSTTHKSATDSENQTNDTADEPVTQ